MRKKRSNNFFSFFLISFGIIFVSVFTFISFVLLYRSFNPELHKQDLLISYNSEDNLNYKVFTKDNSFYQNNELDMDKQYISSIIDKISFTVSYDFESSKLLDYNCNYSILATLVSNYDGEYKDDNLWSEEFIIEPLIDVDLENTNSVKINKTFDIDYQTYNKIMQDFQKEFNLDIDAYLNIDFKVNVKSKVSDVNQIDTNDVINIKIPLLKDTTYITYTKDGVRDDNVWTTLDISEVSSLYFKIIYTIGFVLGIILDSLLIYKCYLMTIKDRHDYEMNQIMKKYDNVLVNVSEVPKHNDLTVINVTNFKDMYDVINELHLPILFKEEKNKTIFFVISGKVFYTYSIKRSAKNTKLSH